MRLCRELIANHKSQANVSESVQQMYAPLNYSTVGELAVGIAKHISERTLPGIMDLTVDRGLLASLARTFHARAETLTTSVCRNIDDIASGFPILIVPHQPNVFPSLGIVCPFIFMDSVASELRHNYQTQTAQLYLIVDYDECSDRRFRTAGFPDLTRKDGRLNLSTGVSRVLHGMPMWIVAKPSPDVVRCWLEELKHSIERMLGIIGRTCTLRSYRQYRDFVYANLNVAQDLIQEAYDLSSTLAEFNAIFLSKIVNQLWGQGISFVPGHLVQKELTATKGWILDHSCNIQHAIAYAAAEIEASGFKSSFAQAGCNDTQFWYYCEDCRYRVPIQKSEDLLILDKVCKDVNGCRQPSTFARTNTALIGAQLLPKVIADNLIDILAFDKCGGTGYIGQAEHVLVGNYVAQVFGLQPPPQLIFSTRWSQIGIVELTYYCGHEAKQPVSTWARDAIRYSYHGKASVLYYGISHGFRNLRDGWFEHFALGGAPNMPRASVPDSAGTIVGIDISEEFARAIRDD